MQKRLGAWEQFIAIHSYFTQDFLFFEFIGSSFGCFNLRKEIFQRCLFVVRFASLEVLLCVTVHLLCVTDRSSPFKNAEDLGSVEASIKERI